MDCKFNLSSGVQIESELLLDDSSVPINDSQPARPDVQERVRLLETERRAAYNQMHRMVADIGALKTGHERWVRELELAQMDAMYRLALIAEYRSGGSPAKVLRIGAMAALVAHAIGFDEAFCERLQIAAPLHDIGEIGLPDPLFSALSLSDTERELMRGHCRIGHRLLADSFSPEIGMAAEIALSHHERFDGSGYPNHLKGEEIPVAAMIVGLVDTFDALGQNRPYRAAHTAAEAAQMVMAFSGSLFCPSVVEAFRRVQEPLLQVCASLNEKSPHAEGLVKGGRSPELGFWKRFV